MKVVIKILIFLLQYMIWNAISFFILYPQFSEKTAENMNAEKLVGSMIGVFIIGIVFLIGYIFLIKWIDKKNKNKKNITIKEDSNSTVVEIKNSEK